MAASPSIVWFKRDLRVQDHRPLAEAARRGPVIPLLVIEPGYWAQPDVSYRHYAFMRDSAQALDAALAEIGARLVVRIGSVIEVLAALQQQVGFRELWSHEETGNGWTYQRDIAIGAWCRAHGIRWCEVPQTGVIRRLRSREGWARHWDRLMAEPTVKAPDRVFPVPGIDRGELPSPEGLGLTFDGCVERQPGGRPAALALLNSFLDGRGRTYRRDMANPLAGATACSRLSPHLAWGAVSLREAAQRTWQRQADWRRETSPQAREANGSLVSFLGRLHWHCHFMQKLESQPAIEREEFHPAMRGLRPRPGDTRKLAAWATGRTGFPFVDACMRSLIATGWINFRMRAMLVSFASYNLWLPWQETGLVLARLFTDYEPGIHWPQMQMQSGTTGINTVRIYNPIKQGHDQDPDGIFVRRWVPELADLPNAFLQAPWTWPRAADVIGSLYPERIVDLEATTASAKDRVYGMRRATDFRDTAAAIQDKHGSRKSGMRITGQTRRSRPRSSDADGQMKLDF